MENETKIIYSGYFPNEQSKELLREIFSDYMKKTSDRITQWEPRIYAHHMTLEFKPKEDSPTMLYTKENMGREFKAVVTAVGISDKACAVELETDIPCQNTKKHITLATNNITNGKPFDSNAITAWEKLEYPLCIKGNIGVFTSNGISFKPLPEAQKEQETEKHHSCGFRR